MSTISVPAAFILQKGMELPYFVEFIALDENGREGRKVRLNGSYLKGNFGPVALAPRTYKINYRQKENMVHRPFLSLNRSLSRLGTL
jgi:hypothetical protein